jgi:hypothetical protein
MSGQSTQSTLSGKLGGAGGGSATMSTTNFGTIGGKPPASGAFKPSFGSIDQLNMGIAATNAASTSFQGSAMKRSNSRQSFDRQNSPSAFSHRSMTSISQNSIAGAPQASEGIPSLASSRQQKSTIIDNSPSKSSATDFNSAIRPAGEPKQFVSKYTKMLYEQQ